MAPTKPCKETPATMQSFFEAAEPDSGATAYACAKVSRLPWSRIDSSQAGVKSRAWLNTTLSTCRTQEMQGDPFGLLLQQRIVFMGGEVCFTCIPPLSWNLSCSPFKVVLPVQNCLCRTGFEDSQMKWPSNFLCKCRWMISWQMLSSVNCCF